MYGFLHTCGLDSIYHQGPYNRRWITLLYSIPRIPECLSLRPNWLPPPRKRLFPPLEQYGGGGASPGKHSLGGEGAGGANSDVWRESLALCILCACNAVQYVKAYNAVQTCTLHIHRFMDRLRGVTCTIVNSDEGTDTLVLYVYYNPSTGNM